MTYIQQLHVWLLSKSPGVWALGSFMFWDPLAVPLPWSLRSTVESWTWHPDVLSAQWQSNWWFQHPWNILVRFDHHANYWGKEKNVPNQQPAVNVVLTSTHWWTYWVWCMIMCTHTYVYIYISYIIYVYSCSLNTHCTSKYVIRAYILLYIIFGCPL